ncbi:MAG TPA: hypothetical protein VKV29_09625 [Chthonomonas sp.]|uniref:hypothetical protein n=1 Tax=Chthonomonas sp. TaxID=2282153 RepID=UPI002B4ADF35|nr:hypothetical protein [Chthonomonas sp.]HLH80526.1 hypothetical protein [Chthonomonas sp.]
MKQFLVKGDLSTAEKFIRFLYDIVEGLPLSLFSNWEYDSDRGELTITAPDDEVPFWEQASERSGIALYRDGERPLDERNEQ